MFKVVKNVNGVLVSAFSLPPCQVTYPVGEKVLPTIPKSKLFVWETLDHAKLNASILKQDNDADYEIWEVMSETPHLEPNRISIYAHDYDGLVDFWNGFGNTKKPWPGTIWLDSLVMSKRVL